MKRAVYRERDYSFGRTMLTLRTAIGLTQSGLANLVGVSRRAVGDWESGTKYPSAAHLKNFIALAVENQAFRVGHEAEEIRALWRSAHEKVLLDEAWLASLLLTGEVSPSSQPSHGTNNDVSKNASASHGPLVDWGDAIAAPSFYGRHWEMSLLQEWLIEERCRVVSVIGMGGIGKSALSVSLMHQVTESFEFVIWRSLRDLPSCEVLLYDLLQLLAPDMVGQFPASTEERLNILLVHLRSIRVLLVLDNLESLMEEGEGIGRMRSGYEGFGRFLRQCAGTEHRSCVLLTSREKPGDLLPYEGSRSPVRTLRLARLDVVACQELLAEKGVKGTASEQGQLIDAYTGNPLALKIVAQTIIDLFDGEIGPFLEQGEVVFGGVRDLLSEQFVRLSAPEQRVLLWLAILREPSTIYELCSVMVTSVPRARLLEAVVALSRRSLIEHSQRPGSFTLQSVVLEYATAQLVAEVSEEVRQGKLTRLIDHGLELAQSTEYVRQNQERLIVAPILADLRSAYRQHPVLEETLLGLMRQLAARACHEQGYGPANLVTLLRLVRGHLRGVDLSGLAIRGAYLQGIEMADASLAGATIRDSVFTENFDAVMGVAISPNGGYWAASSRTGEIRVWKAVGPPWVLTLHRAWQAHTDLIWPLSFSPDARFLASGSWDSTVKLWDIASGALLWSGRHLSDISSVAYAPNGKILASSGNDATILWDLESGEQSETLPRPELVISVAWSPDGKLLAGGGASGSIQLWEVSGPGPARCIQTLVGHTALVSGVAFSPDGRMLGTASADGTVKLWDISDGILIDTLTGHTDRVHRLAWSPDGSLLASCGFGKSILLWDVGEGRYRAELIGHADTVSGLAFTPDSRTLFSGGDSTLRTWDIASGQCIRVLEGNAAALFDLDWSPDSRNLVSGGSDALVTTLAITGETSPRVLRGHQGLVFGVAWSPDGARLASGSWDMTIRLWDPVSGACVQVIADPEDSRTFFCDVAWSPDGQQLAGAVYLSPKGVLVWDMSNRLTRRMRTTHPTPIRRVSWSPDGKQLAGGGEDGSIYLWEAANCTLLRQLEGHERNIRSIAWSTDGSWLASGGSGRDGGELFLWDQRRQEHIGSLAGHPQTVSAVTWGLDEGMLVSGDGDGTLRWWDIQQGKCLLETKAHRGTVQSLRRSPDGTKLASCGDNGAIMLWDLRTGQHLKTLRRDRPYERLKITGIKGLTEVQLATLHALGAIEDGSLSPVLI
jgi:WD40 repeat protein/transcriptional regulator with XRE-family HTH domain